MLAIMINASQVYLFVVLFCAAQARILSGSDFFCRDPDTGKLHATDTTWASTAFCGNYTCTLRRKNVTASEYAPFRQVNVNKINLFSTVLGKRPKSVNIKDKKIDTNLEDKDHSSFNMTDAQPQEDRYLTDKEIRILSEILHLMKKSDLDAIIDIYKFAQDIYKDIDTSGIEDIIAEAGEYREKATLEKITNADVNAFNVRAHSYWNDPGFTNTGSGDLGTQGTNIITSVSQPKKAENYFIGPLISTDFRKLPYYYPVSNFQRKSSYRHPPLGEDRSLPLPPPIGGGRVLPVSPPLGKDRGVPLPPPTGGGRNLPVPPLGKDRGLPLPPLTGDRNLPVHPALGKVRALPLPPPVGGGKDKGLPLPPSVGGGRVLPVPSSLGGVRGLPLPPPPGGGRGLPAPPRPGGDKYLTAPPRPGGDKSRPLYPLPAFKIPGNLKNAQKRNHPKDIQPSIYLPYPFAYIHNYKYNSSAPNKHYESNFDKYTIYSKNKFPYIHIAKPSAYLNQVPNAVLVNTRFSKDGREHVKASEKRTQEVSKGVLKINIEGTPDWQTSPLAADVLEEVRAHAQEKANIIRSLRKNVKIEKVGKLLKLDDLPRNKREAAVSQESIADVELYEVILDKTTCGSNDTVPGYFRYGNLSHPFPECCPQRIGNR